ncbi:MAG: hypothetical protein N2Z58_03420 [Fervidobacterium sp.]|nr:hypothetical protein [Fervidobacterium sp.]
MKTNILALVFLFLIFVMFLDIFTNNLISTNLHTVLYKLSTPLYNVRTNLEQVFEKEHNTINVTLFGDTRPTALRVLSVDSKGIYVRNVEKKGIVISATDGSLIGFVKKTGSVGYVSKWWEEEFPVTIESSEGTDVNFKVKVVGYYSNYRIEIPDPSPVNDGKVYMSEYLPYGKLLKSFGLSIGEYQNGVFKMSIPKIPEYVLILEKYEPNGGN